MFETIVANMEPLLGTLGYLGRNTLGITVSQEKQMKAIIELLSDFREAGELLGSENEITVSKILPTFEALKTKLVIDTKNDLPVIKDMKRVMLEKMNLRYSQQQIDFLAACSILDTKIKVDGPDSCMKQHVDGGLHFCIKKLLFIMIQMSEKQKQNKSKRRSKHRSTKIAA